MLMQIGAKAETKPLASFRNLAKASALMLLCVAAKSFAADPSGSSFVNLGTHRLHLNCTGYGSPVVVFDSGLGSLSLEFEQVQMRLAQYTKVCRYDRAGYGYSDFGPMPRTSSRIANELYLLLEAAELEGPYVLVGHSFGGYTMQLFAKRFPYMTAGLVLVDASHPEQIERFEQPPYKLNTAPRSRRGKMVMSQRPTVPENFPAEYRDHALALVRQWRSIRTVKSEFFGFRDSAMQVRQAGPEPDVPTVVVTRGQRVWPDGERGDMLESLWMELQGELAEFFPRSAHIVAADSRHHVHLDRPEVVADAITMVFDFARRDDAPKVRRVATTTSDDAQWLNFSRSEWRRDTLHDVALNLGISPPESVQPRGSGESVRVSHLMGTKDPDQHHALFWR